MQQIYSKQRGCTTQNFYARSRYICSGADVMAGEIERFKALEEDGRRRSAERDSKPKGDNEFLAKMHDAAAEMSNFFRNLGENNFQRFAAEVGNVATSANMRVHNCELGGLTRAECDMKQMDWRLGEMDAESKVATGKKCTYLRGEVPNYHLGVFLNDLTACFHRNLEKYEEFSAEWEVSGKCMWRKK